jgi:hypothetical protein
MAPWWRQPPRILARKRPVPSPPVPHGSIDCNPSDCCRGIFIADNNVQDRPRIATSFGSVSRPAGPATRLKWLPSEAATARSVMCRAHGWADWKGPSRVRSG